MALVLALLLFCQTAPTDLYTPSLVNTVDDLNNPGQIDLLFHDADTTVWGTSQISGCSWLEANMELVWTPAASGGKGELNRIGLPGDICWVDTFALDNE